MKVSIKLINCFVMVSVFFSTAIASSLDDGALVVFQTNTKAIASEVNNNFNVIESAVNDNDTRISDNKVSIDAHTSEISVHATDLANKSENIQKNSEAVTVNATAIQGNSTTINTHTSDIATLKSDLKKNTDSITANISSIEGNTAIINTHATDIATLKSDLQKNSEAVASHTTAIETNTTTANSHTTDIANNATAINENTAAITTNGLDVNANRLNVEANRTAINDNKTAINAITAMGIAGVQVTDFNSAIDVVDDKNYVELLSVDVPVAGTINVQLTAHAYTEAMNNAPRFDFSICQTDCGCALRVGRTFYRPEINTIQATSVALTGYGAGIEGPATFKFCAKKFDFSAVDATVYLRGLNVMWASQ